MYYCVLITPLNKVFIIVRFVGNFPGALFPVVFSVGRVDGIINERNGVRLGDSTHLAQLKPDRVQAAVKIATVAKLRQFRGRAACKSDFRLTVKL